MSDQDRGLSRGQRQGQSRKEDGAQKQGQTSSQSLLGKALTSPMRVVALPFRLFFKPANDDEHQDSPRDRERPLYRSQRVAYPFCAGALSFLAIQVILASGASLEFMFPDLRLPIPFNLGRSMHVNLAIFWPVLGVMGGVYYVLPEEADAEIHSPFLAYAHFWLMVAAIVLAQVGLALGFTVGREYLEAPTVFKALFALAIIMFLYNVIRTFKNTRFQELSGTAIAFMLGIGISVAFYIPTFLFYRNVIVDELVKFWTVHIWVEGSFELVIAGLLVPFLIALTGVQREKLEKWFFLEVCLVVATAFLAVGHHYFWIGTPLFWQGVGATFGALQAVPILFLVWTAYSATQRAQLEDKLALPFLFLISAVFWNLVGAGLYGLALTFPVINLYTHGTILTSAHAHLALFGTYGFIVLAFAYYILPGWHLTQNLNQRWGLVALVLLNIGLVVMGGALTVAGILQVYLWRLLGMDFITVRQLVSPVMAVRTLGAVVFAAGGLIPWTNVLLCAAAFLRRKPHLQSR